MVRYFGSNYSRMHRISTPLAIFYLLAQSLGKHSQIQLRPSIGNITVVLGLLEVKIILLKSRLPSKSHNFPMRNRGHINNPKMLGFVQFVPQKMGEIEVAEVVYSVMDLMILFGMGEGWKTHYCCVIDEDVDFVVLQVVSEVLDALQITQINFYILYHLFAQFLVYFFHNILGIDNISNNNLTSLLSKFFHQFSANATISSSYHSHTPFQICSISDVDSTSEIFFYLPCYQSYAEEQKQKGEKEILHQFGVQLNILIIVSCN